MKQAWIKVTALVAPVMLAACASAPPVPPLAPIPQPLETPILASSTATQPSGPSDIGAMIAGRTQKKATMSGELPAGHPPIGQMPELPKGHPDISQMEAAAKAASTQPTKSASSASVTVRAVQSTAGGPKIAELPVTLEFRQGEQVVEKRDVKLGADGTLRMDEIPLTLAAAPFVRISYQGVEYTAAGEILDAAHADQQIQIPVYETTEVAPSWSVSMQHVMLEPSVDGVRVMEMVSVTNPTDRAWIGKPGPDNKRQTLALTIPQNAKDVQFAGGFHDCCVKVTDGKVVDSMALLPGTSQYRIAYSLPVSDSRAEVALTAAAAVKHFMLFLPDDGSKVESQGMGNIGVADMGGGKTRFFKATDVAAVAHLKLNISAITATASAKTVDGSPVTRSPASAGIAKAVAGIGGLAIFVIGGFLVMSKAPRAHKA